MSPAAIWIIRAATGHSYRVRNGRPGSRPAFLCTASLCRVLSSDIHPCPPSRLIKLRDSSPRPEASGAHQESLQRPEYIPVAGGQQLRKFARVMDGERLSIESGRDRLLSCNPASPPGRGHRATTSRPAFHSEPIPSIFLPRATPPIKAHPTQEFTTTVRSVDCYSQTPAGGQGSPCGVIRKNGVVGAWIWTERDARHLQKLSPPPEPYRFGGTFQGLRLP